MPNFIKKPVVIEAHQWFKNGDHPKDNCLKPYGEGKVVRYFKHKDYLQTEHCLTCNKQFRDHGWLADVGQRICPGDWVITDPNTGEYYSCRRGIFPTLYEEVL
jgi:hypothetical protein